MMRIVVFGRSGQLARELARQCPADISMTCLGRDQADLADPAACAVQITEQAADIVINAAAYTAVDKAEDDRDSAMRVNGDAPAAMAQACAAHDIPFLHVSTDYVFDGTGTKPWAVTDTPAPLNTYGASKLAGENAVRAAGGAHVILRTSWVFSAHGTNFVKTMLRLGAERDALRIVGDQVGGPTAASDIATCLLSIAKAFHAGQGVTGLYHFSGTPDVSWADFARAIFVQAGLDCDVTAIPTADYPTAAQRPLNSRLDCSALTRDYGIMPPDWQASLRAVIDTVKKGPQ